MGSTQYPFGDELVRYSFENTLANAGVGSTTYDTAFTGNGAFTNDAVMGRYAAVLDGSGDAVDTKFGNGRNPSSAPFSISLWCKRTGAGGGSDQHLMGTSATPAATRCYVRYRQASGFFGMRVMGNTEVLTSVTVTLNQVFHVCLVMDGTTARLYIDGTQAATDSYTTYTLPGPIYVGNIWENGVAQATQGWAGNIDEVAIYQRALSAADVLTIKKATTPTLLRVRRSGHTRRTY